MLRKIEGALVLLSVLFSTVQAFDTFYPFEVATGKIKTPAENLGGPWFQDGYGPAFGTDKDSTIKFSASNNRLQIAGTEIAIVGEATLTGALNQTAVDTTQTLTLNRTNMVGVYYLGNTTATQTINLPAAGTVSGRIVEFNVVRDPGSNNVVLDAYSNEMISGAATKTSTDSYTSMTLRSYGTGWIITSSMGTWS